MDARFATPDCTLTATHFRIENFKFNQINCETKFWQFYVASIGKMLS